MKNSWKKIAPHVFVFTADSCNVYLLRYGKRAIAIDFGTGVFLEHLSTIGVDQIEHVVLTHAHRDQCCGLYRRDQAVFLTHAPAGDRNLLDPTAQSAFWDQYQNNGCPPNYAAPRLPIADLQYDLSADSETQVGPALFCSIATPGHTRGALTYLVQWQGYDLAFCGDAVHAGATLHQPYHLEWDHWTPGGALDAWRGLERLGYCHFDMLLPAHGTPITRRAHAILQKTQKRLMDLARAKGSVCAGAKNRWLATTPLANGSSRVLPHLYHFGANSFLLLSARGEGFVVDPQLADIEQLPALMQTLGIERISATTATHYHSDHSDALNYVRQRFGAAVWLHPQVAAPIADRDTLDVPWLPKESVLADRRLPATGHFRWNEYRFAIRPFPGQTFWHCAFDAVIDERHVLFSGDNFQPPSRWNGTGGFCAFNGSRFGTGFGHSAQVALDLAPDIVCNGHGCIYPFSADHYRRILRWAKSAEQSVRALCPSANWLADYDPRALRLTPFVQSAKPGQTLDLQLVHNNHSQRPVNLSVHPVPPNGWTATPDLRRAHVAAQKERALHFVLRLPRTAAPGRHIFTVDAEIDGQLCAEACVALIDIADK